MRRVIVAVAAAASLGAAASAQAFSLSYLNDFLWDIGVDVTVPEIEIDLPPKAEQAVEDALGHAQSAIDKVFGEGGVLDDYELPDVDQIVEDALSKAEAAASAAREKAQSAIDDALSHAENVLDDLDIPSVNLPEFDIPDVDVPDVDSIVEDALSKAEDAVYDALEDAHDALDHAHGVLDDVEGVLDDILSEIPSVESVIADLPLDELPAPAVTAIESAFNSIGFFSLPNTAAVAVPEPTSLAVAAGGLLALAVGRRRR